MKNLVFISYFILFFACNSTISQNEKLSDIESIQLKTSFVDLKNKKVDLTSYIGKRIIINHWATWCGPCIKEMPGIKRAQEILKNHNYTFLLVSDENVSKISKFKNDKKYDFNFLKSVGSNETLGIYSLPTSYIFDEKGMKIETIVGTIIWDSDQMIKKLKTL
ncbi:MAG: thiol-disulfide isomerase/thioredoxin [Flavobacteriaceae bacterium]|mgnify:CR=1 FL=1|jgi:thiol-disulfide isomerase/thioredoxin|tara:strand:- start:9854 stop:10342 length:489 start_codon:yes stop_codon:yes gene_type:complete